MKTTTKKNTISNETNDRRGDVIVDDAISLIFDRMSAPIRAQIEWLRMDVIDLHFAFVEDTAAICFTVWLETPLAEYQFIGVAFKHTIWGMKITPNKFAKCQARFQAVNEFLLQNILWKILHTNSQALNFVHNLNTNK